jgi:hypothetical protein
MIDERQKEVFFNIELKEEIEIKNSLPNVNIIILTGEAGDGKSRMLRNIEKELLENGFQIVSDFSALSEKRRDEIIMNIGVSNINKYIIAANVGIFTKTLLKKDPKLLSELTSNSKVKIINFQKRNLAKKINDEDNTFESIVKDFLKYDGINCNCILYEQCPFKKNIDKLTDSIVIENLRVLCDSLYLMGEHITFRELLSLMSYMVTGGEDCESIINNYRIINYYDIFEDSTDILLKKFYRLDPAIKKDITHDGDIYKNSNGSLIIFKQSKRKNFFEKENKNAYASLPVEYLSEFRSIIKKLHSPPYYLMARDNNELLVDVKKGLIKLISPQETNLEISFYDTPSKISKEIKTKFTIDINNIELFWNRYDFKFRAGELSQETENNSFSLSCYFTSSQEQQVVSLNINYTLFKYILSARDDLYLKENSEIVEEFGLSDFFRKVLRNNSSTYEEMQVIFCEKRTQYIDFALKKYRETVLFSDSKEKVLIRKI